MSYSLQIHLENEEPLVIDVEGLPDPQAEYIVGTNPRRRDGKEIPYILEEVTTVILPWRRITIVQVLPSAEEEEVTTFVRD